MIDYKLILTMLVNIDREDQLQIARNVYRKVKRQQHNRGISLQRQKLTSQYRQHLHKIEDGVKLPNISHKAKTSNDQHGVLTRRSTKKQTLDSTKIIELIKRQISIDKKNYQTISSDKALIIKNSARSNHSTKGLTEPLQNIVRHRMTQEQICQVMTPPYKIFRQKPKESQNRSLSKEGKKSLVHQWQKSYSPWNHTQSEEVGF